MIWIITLLIIVAYMVIGLIIMGFIYINFKRDSIDEFINPMPLWKMLINWAIGWPLILLLRS
ncbi:hypothetical protein A9X05_09155 [Mycobacterium sp. E3298]|nr:hypothetical protein A9X05_09155 [Mycobacterium sp. E3298]